MNQRGEAILFCLFLLTLLSGLLTLCGLELHRSYQQLEKRSKIFLCVKEIKGETTRFVKHMGRANWMIKNTSRAQYLLALIPGLQAGALKARELKKMLQKFQQTLLLQFVGKLDQMKQHSCPIDAQLFLTPFQVKLMSYNRGKEGEALIRKKKWTYSFSLNPYLLTMDLDLKAWEKPHPSIGINIQEKQGILLFPYSFH